MLSSIAKRRPQLGQSFTSCLLMVVLFFGGIGFYYFKIYQWQDLESPLEGLEIVKNDDAPALADFRRFTVANVIDPGIQEMQRLVKLRKGTNAATAPPEDFEQLSKEISYKLRDLMSVARLRRIPSTYQKQYNDVLNGISKSYRSLRKLEEAVGEDLPDAKKRALEESIKLSNEAKRHFNVSRGFFHIQQR